ncbi:uncharacterized protein KY384_004119 [Bacidia gigantensis]|uniref:uncharacterized protein n=1 Tax=Bacidia gigantensis TaxID=2732470 RepID=UPI001D038C9B|nr:uncharacterized protein KY384_004119 [Bacidia gigantensis]KAG8530762.1 hypothetical protein KY384_004119 [Bacidia gigantensis]
MPHKSTIADLEASAAPFNIKPADLGLLLNAAVEAKELAYCPYSNFRVGAAVLPASTRPTPPIVKGANVENASYPVGTCAERCCLSKAVTEGTKREFVALAVATDVKPADGEFVVKTMQELLPDSFGPENMGQPQALGDLEG